MRNLAKRCGLGSLLPALIDTLYDREEVAVYMSANALSLMGVLALPRLLEALSADQAVARAEVAGPRS